MQSKINEHSLDCGAGWLSPDGKLIPCSYMEHTYYAGYILKIVYGIDKCRIADDKLLSMNWHKLQSYQWQSLDWIGFGESLIRPELAVYPPTQKQIDTIFEWCEKHGKPMPKLDDED